MEENFGDTSLGVGNVLTLTVPLRDLKGVGGGDKVGGRGGGGDGDGGWWGGGGNGETEGGGGDICG